MFLASDDNSERKAKREDEELATLKRFIENQDKAFFKERAIQDRLKIKEPVDIFYEGELYQVTYGDAAELGRFRKEIDKNGLTTSIRRIEIDDYARVCIESALDKKRNKSDENVVLLVDCTGTSYQSYGFREGKFKEYFNNKKSELGGLWKNIFVVFPDGNIQLR
jgi:hypothetical protein